MDSEDYKELRERATALKASNRASATEEILALATLSQYKVTKCDEYHYRVNDEYDLYPTTRRIFKMGDTRHWAGWKKGELLQKMNAIYEKGGITKKTFDVAYFVNGRIREKLAEDLPWAIAEQTKRKAQASGQYKTGILRTIQH